MIHPQTKVFGFLTYKVLIKKLFPNKLSYFSWIIVGLGTICLIISAKLSQDPATIQHGYGYGSIGLGLISIGIAFHSISQAEDSDEKMKALVKLKIREKKDQYENSRYGSFCEIGDKLEKGKDVKHLLGSIAYEGGLFIEEIALFKKWLDSDDKERIADYLFNLIDTLMADTSLLVNSDVEEYLKAINKAIDAEIIVGNEKQLVDFIEILVGKKKTNESFKVYIECKINDIQKLDSNEAYLKEKTKKKKRTNKKSK